MLILASISFMTAAAGWHALYVYKPYYVLV